MCAVAMLSTAPLWSAGDNILYSGLHMHSMSVHGMVSCNAPALTGTVQCMHIFMLWSVCMNVCDVM